MISIFAKKKIHFKIKNGTMDEFLHKWKMIYST